MVRSGGEKRTPELERKRRQLAAQARKYDAQKRTVRPRGATTRIYTRRGDFGETEQPALGRVSKSHPRLDATGSLDELNCALGDLTARIEEADLGASDRRTLLRRTKRVQREIFDLGSRMSGARPSRRGPSASQRRRVVRLEKEIGAMEDSLSPCKGFILPGGGTLPAAAHVARAVCRRAERCCVAALADDALAQLIIPYLNRLSDWLFVLARWMTALLRREDDYWRKPAKPRRSGGRR